MRLCAAGFTSSQRNPRYCDSVVGRFILTELRLRSRCSGARGIPPYINLFFCTQILLSLIVRPFALLPHNVVHDVEVPHCSSLWVSIKPKENAGPACSQGKRLVMGSGRWFSCWPRNETAWSGLAGHQVSAAWRGYWPPKRYLRSRSVQVIFAPRHA